MKMWKNLEAVIKMMEEENKIKMRHTERVPRGRKQLRKRLKMNQNLES